ncbi:MAG TPA: TIR domain-containing protein [Candidatus Saccharimonadales bacterium]|nr:TIR domain-containing protein [Candidatus Saccharimonadales bacterium]
MKKIFYSWQSDVKPARNKIKAALELAAKRLGDQLEEADRSEIDSDTKNTHGSEDIIETIFSKIDQCAIFVADVTPIASTDKKLIPNPNVMTEVGYAIKAKGKWTRLYIYCTDQSVDESKMPFDIRGKSLIGFSLSDTPSSIAERLIPDLEGMLKNAPHGNVKLALLDDGGGWANWSTRGNVMSSFRYHLSIDNFGGKLEYIDNIEIVAQDGYADPWTTKWYAFDDHRPNEKLRVEQDEILDIWVQLTDDPGQSQRMFDSIDLDRDVVKLVVTLKSTGQQIVLPIPAGRLVNR